MDNNSNSNDNSNSLTDSKHNDDNINSNSVEDGGHNNNSNNNNSNNSVADVKNQSAIRDDLYDLEDRLGARYRMVMLTSGKNGFDLITPDDIIREQDQNQETNKKEDTKCIVN